MLVDTVVSRGFQTDN